MNNSSRVIVIISDCVDTFPALVFSALVNRCEWIQAWVDRHQFACSRTWSVSRFPCLNYSSAIGAKNITGILAHSSRWYGTPKTCAASSPARVELFSVMLAFSPEIKPKEAADDAYQSDQANSQPNGTSSAQSTTATLLCETILCIGRRSWCDSNGMNLTGGRVYGNDWSDRHRCRIRGLQKISIERVNPSQKNINSLHIIIGPRKRAYR